MPAGSDFFESAGLMAAMTEDDLEVLAQATSLAHFSQGDEVYAPYSRATAVLLVLQGSVEVWTNGESGFLYAAKERGSVLGEELFMVSCANSDQSESASPPHHPIRTNRNRRVLHITQFGPIGIGEPSASSNSDQSELASSPHT
eukprot:5760516-Pyramimonas_sp.AAC.1